MHTFYSNGKLLLTGEYVVLDGAKALAVPSKFGQNLSVSPIKENKLIWGSFTNENNCWFEAHFSLPNLRLISATFNSNSEGSSDAIAETLQHILREAKQLNPSFLSQENGFMVKTELLFPRNWGLGSSSTLINNIASWANVNPFTLLWNSFSGSGYDIACAKHNQAIFYQLKKDHNPKIQQLSYSPTFKDELFFIHLNKKQNSREGIKMYRKNIANLSQEIRTISMLSDAFFNAKNTTELNHIINEHEKLIGSIIKQKPIQQELFNDYFGAIKSLGAWGGDFILATGNDDSISYFNKKGFTTVLSYNEMVL